MLTINLCATLILELGVCSCYSEKKEEKRIGREARNGKEEEKEGKDRKPEYTCSHKSVFTSF